MTQQQVIFTVGLPSSGKSTWANKWSSEKGYETFRKISCRDDIRMHLSEASNRADVPRDKNFEKQVTLYQEEQISEYLFSNYDVCAADTNLNPSTLHRLTHLVKDYSEDVEIIINDSFLDVPLPEIFKRNSKRGSEYVPEDAIFTMWEKYIKGRSFIEQDKLSKPDCVVFDIDGTLAIMGDRSPYEWDKVGLDTLNKPVASLLNAYYESRYYDIIIVSGRDGICKSRTEDWLIDNSILYTHVFMREPGDSRVDWEVKEEILRNKILPKYHVNMWVDDRQQVVLRMRELGIPVAQVDFGRF